MGHWRRPQTPILAKNIYRNIPQLIQRTCFTEYLTQSDMIIFVAVYSCIRQVPSVIAHMMNWLEQNICGLICTEHFAWRFAIKRENFNCTEFYGTHQKLNWFTRNCCYGERKLEKNRAVHWESQEHGKNSKTNFSVTDGLLSQNTYYTRLILGLRPANQRHRYKATRSLVGWAQS